jgi:hypothetical protein
MLPTETADRMLATEPDDPMDRIEPDEPMDRIEPAEPMDRMEPVDPMDHSARDDRSFRSPVAVMPPCSQARPGSSGPARIS